MINDWRKAVRTPISYSVTNDTLRLQRLFVTVVSAAGVVFLVVLYVFVPKSRVVQQGEKTGSEWLHVDHQHFSSKKSHCYETSFNSTYPLTAPEILTDDKIRFRIAMVADLDTNSKSNEDHNSWLSYLQKGYLTYYPEEEVIEIVWDKRSTLLKSSYSLAGRGMELSDLVVFNGNLYTCDDRTGIVYKIVGVEMIPWIILSDGNGHSSKGFKCEWMTVKDKNLYVGGLGKEWTTTTGVVLNHNPQWIKKISSLGSIEHINWSDYYNNMCSASGLNSPGYMIHESAMWSHFHHKWFFLPRRASTTKYNEVEDERKGTNIIISFEENMSNIHIDTVGPLIPTHGFSSFKFIPLTNDKVIVALKTEENNGETATYITAFTITGKVLLPEKRIKSNKKFEGIEFI